MRHFKYIGPSANPELQVYFGDGSFTVGKVYSTDSVDEYEDSMQLPDADFIDDSGEVFTEELWMFEEVQCD